MGLLSTNITILSIQLPFDVPCQMFRIVKVSNFTSDIMSFLNQNVTLLQYDLGLKSRIAQNLSISSLLNLLLPIVL